MFLQFNYYFCKLVNIFAFQRILHFSATIDILPVKFIKPTSYSLGDAKLIEVN